jgi:hypothetical protein
LGTVLGRELGEGLSEYVPSEALGGPRWAFVSLNRTSVDPVWASLGLDGPLNVSMLRVWVKFRPRCPSVALGGPEWAKCGPSVDLAVLV